MDCSLAPRRWRSAATCRQSDGFALIIVLWTLVLMAFIVAQLTSSGRTEVRIAGNLVADAVADAADDGAIFAAIFNLSDPNPAQRWALDGTVHELTIGNSRVMVRLEDEAGLINPNLASPALLEALLRVTGSEPESARRLAGAIGEWVGSAPVARPQNPRRQVRSCVPAQFFSWQNLRRPLHYRAGKIPQRFRASIGRRKVCPPQ